MSYEGKMCYYLLLFWIELNELLQKYHKEGNADHTHDANRYNGKSAQVCPRIEVTIAYSGHGHKAHPEGIQEVAEVLLFVVRSDKRSLPRLNHGGSY